MRTHGPLCNVHLENFPDHASALWFTPCRVRPARRKATASISGGWAVLPPPAPASFLFWETIVGVPTSPKLPPLKKKGGKAASWLNKAETPVCQKHTDVDRHSTAAVPSAQRVLSGCLGRRPIRVGNPHHTKRFLWSSLSPCPRNSPSHVSQCFTQGWIRNAKNNLWLLKGLKGSYLSGGIFPLSFLILPFWSGLEGQMERKRIQNSVLTQPLS